MDHRKLQVGTRKVLGICVWEKCKKLGKIAKLRISVVLCVEKSGGAGWDGGWGSGWNARIFGTTNPVPWKNPWDEKKFFHDLWVLINVVKMKKSCHRR